MITVGDKTKLAVEFEPTNRDGLNTEGLLYLYINGVKFGDSNEIYNYYWAVSNVVSGYEKPERNLPSVFNVPGVEIINALSAYTDFYYEDDGSSFEHRILEKTPSFVDFADELNRCRFTYVPYAFDQCCVLVIPADNKLKICAEDERHVWSEVVSTYENFYGLWHELKVDMEKALT